MSSIINNLQNEINVPLRSSLVEGFLSNFNAIFSYDNNDIEVIGTVEKPWFKAKDVLMILSYNENTESLKKFKQKNIPEKYKKERVGVLRVPQPLSTSNYHKDKEIFINEGGLYRLIMRSNKPNAEPFQDFVLVVLLPNIRNQIIQNFKSENNSLRNENDLLRNNMQIVIKKLDSIEISQFQTRTQLDEIHSKLHESNNKLDKALPDRNINPKDEDLNHYYVLFKNKDSSNEYMFIRGQEKYIKDRKFFYMNNFDIIIDSRRNPNPIDLVNRLKEEIKKINILNYSVIEDNFKCSGEYRTLSHTKKRKKILDLKKENSKILYRINKITLIDYTEKKFLELINKLDDERYNV